MVEISNTSVDVTERLDSMLGAVNSFYEARQTLLFTQESSSGPLVMAHAWPREGRRDRPLSVDSGRGKLESVALSRQPAVVQFQGPTGDVVLDALCRKGETAGLMPVMDDSRVYAVLTVILPPGRGLSEDDIRLLRIVAREMAGAIRNYRLYFEAKRRIAELNVLSHLGRAAVSTIELDELLQTVASICAKLLGAKGGLVSVESINGEAVRLQSSYGMVPACCLNNQDFFNAAQKCEPVRAQDGVRLCRLAGDGKEQFTGLCSPLSFKGSYKGHLCVFEKAGRQEESSQAGFSAEDQNLLGTMASMISSALENALSFQRVEDLAERNEVMVGALATLFEISTVLMTTVDFDETVQIILHAVTHPAGLDHDRVILFLLNGKEMVLRPVADMRKENIWGPNRELTQTLLDVKKEHAHTTDSVLDEKLIQVEVPLDAQNSVLARTVIEKKAIQVDDFAVEENAAPQFIEAMGPHPFVTVPMFAKGKVIGVLVVNNAQSGRAFTDRDFKLLAMLANLGGLAVENSRLYQNLEFANKELAEMRSRLLEADKLAALGEVAAGVAHEIRNPLVSIGGFTRRIRKKVDDDSPIRPYLDVIIDEVTRLERTLNEMLDFSTDARHNFEEKDLNQIMDQALDLLWKELEENKIQVVRDYNPELPQVFCDDRQMKHVFFNIYLNAIQAMGSEGGQLTLRSFSVMREGKQFIAGEVADTGGGIGMDVIHNIFNPFFTTKDTGSGLGLSIVHKIVTRHFGQVEVHNREGKGATFLVTLPAAEEGRAYLK